MRHNLRPSDGLPAIGAVPYWYGCSLRLAIEGYARRSDCAPFSLPGTRQHRRWKGFRCRYRAGLEESRPDADRKHDVGTARRKYLSGNCSSNSLGTLPDLGLIATGQNNQKFFSTVAPHAIVGTNGAGDAVCDLSRDNVAHLFEI